jgi:hypothetical protein
MSPAALATIVIDSAARREFAVLGTRHGSTTAQGGNPMKNPLDSLWGTIVSGLVLTLILYFVAKSLLA